jgi:hypothetical protein
MGTLEGAGAPQPWPLQPAQRTGVFLGYLPIPKAGSATSLSYSTTEMSSMVVARMMAVRVMLIRKCLDRFRCGGRLPEWCVGSAMRSGLAQSSAGPNTRA